MIIAVHTHPYALKLHRNSSFTRKNDPRVLKFFRWPHLTKLRNPNIILTIQFPGRGGVIYHPPGLTLPKLFFLLHKLIVKTPTQPQLNLTSTKVLGLTRLLLFTYMLWNLPYMLWNLHRNSSFTRKNGPRGLKFFSWPHLTKLRNPNIILTIQFHGEGGHLPSPRVNPTKIVFSSP